MSSKRLFMAASNAEIRAFTMVLNSRSMTALATTGTPIARQSWVSVMGGGISLLRWALARLDVEDAFFEGGDADPHVVRREFGGVESRGLALGLAVKGGKQVGFDFAGEFLGAVLGGLDFGSELGGACLDGCGDGSHGVVEGIA
jgi:hypothetical protein